MSKIDNLLSRLSGVKKTGVNQWVAKCCAHNDKSPSMTIYLAMCDLDKGIELSSERITNLKKAAGRIYSASELGGQ